MVHAMRELYQQLLDDKCWLPLLSGGRTAADLTELDLQTLGTMTMSLMANLFLRCVLPFRDEWPWHLIHVYAGDPTALNQFLACNTDCCFSAVDGYSDALNWLCPSAAEVLARRERDCWNDTVDMCPSSNILLEDMFARHANYCHSAGASPLGSGTQAAFHTLGQYRLMYEVAKQRWRIANPARIVPEYQHPQGGGVRKFQYQNYLKFRCAQGVPQDEIRAEWKGMSRDEQSAYEQAIPYGRTEPAQPKFPPIPRSELPHEIGCDSLPVVIDDIRNEVQPNINKLNKAWCDRTSSLIKSAQPSELGAASWVGCASVYGIGNCVASMLPDRVALLDEAIDLAERVAAFPACLLVDGRTLPNLNAFEFVGENGRLIFILAATLLLPVVPVFLRCNVAPSPAQPGSIMSPMWLDFRQGFLKKCIAVQLIADLGNPRTMQVNSIIYHWESRTTLQVDAVVDCTDRLRNPPKKARKEDKDPIEQLLTGFGENPLKRKRSGAPRRRIRRKTKIVAMNDEVDDDAGSNASSDDDDAASDADADAVAGRGRGRGRGLGRASDAGLAAGRAKGSAKGRAGGADAVDVVEMLLRGFRAMPDPSDPDDPPPDVVAEMLRSMINDIN